MPPTLRNTAGRLTNPLLLLILLPLLLLSPALFSDKALFWGTPALQFVPWWDLAWEQLSSGQLPLWNPLAGLGAPLAANYQSALFYPPTWIYFLLAAMGGTALLAWGQALLVALHWIVAAWGMAAVARRIGLGTLPQVLAGLAFGLSSYMVARAGFLSINAAAAWLPWILALTFDLAWLGQHRGLFARLGLVTALQLLAGHAQTTWYTWMLAGAWTGFWAWRRARSPAGRPGGGSAPSGKVFHFMVGRWAVLALAGLLGALLAGIQLLPTVEYLMQSQRAAAVDFDFAMTYSFWPWRFLTLLAPDLFGNPARGDYWGYAAFWEDAVYVGLLPLLLAIGALFRGLRRGDNSAAGQLHESAGPSAGDFRALTGFLAGLMALSFLLALGSNTPVFPWLYRHIPTFDMFQAPARFLLWAVVALALLGALGAERWRRPEGRGLYWTRLGTAGAFAVSLAAGLAWALLGEVQPTFLRATALAGIFGLGAGFLSLRAPVAGDRPGQGWTWAVLGLLGLDLLIAGWGLNPVVDLEFYQQPAGTLPQVHSLLGDGRLFLPVEQEYQVKFERFLTFSSFDPDEDWTALRDTLLPNLNLLDRIPHANNFDPLLPERYVRWIGAVETAPLAVQQRLMNLSAISVVEVVDRQNPTGVKFLPAGQGSRFRWLPCSRPAVDGEEAWEIVRGDSFDSEIEVVVEGDLQVGNAGCQSASGQGQVQVLAEEPARVVLSVQAPVQGWLVQSDVWYPGWRVRVDQVAAPLVRANFLFRAVRVPAGEHRVEIEYRPASFWFGTGLSGLTGLLLALRGILGRR